MPVLAPNTPPPPDYYADNLRRLADGVAAQYNDLLCDDERLFVAQLQRLSPHALRLFARLLTRTGPAIRIDRLVYAEVPDRNEALAELVDAGLVSLHTPLPADRLLRLLTIPELQAAFPFVPADRKPLLVNGVASRYPDPEIRKRLAAVHPWLTLARPDLVATLCVLFFGTAERDLTTFVLEDLGVWRFESYPTDRTTRLFASRDDLDRYLAFATVRAQLPQRADGWNGSRVERLLDELWAPQRHRWLELERRKLLDRLGALAERARDADMALSAYARSASAFGRERTVRLRARLHDEEGVATLLEQIREAPRSQAELDFARRFDRVRCRVAVPCRTLRTERLRLPGPPDRGVEHGALDALLGGDQRRGIGAHLENRFPLALFGLAFWDVVFAPLPGAFANAYQLGPIDLFWADFANVRAERIERRVAELASRAALHDRVADTWVRKHGVNNALVAWDALDLALIGRAIDALPFDGIVALLEYLAHHLGEARTGFPDLVVLYDDGSYAFIEVKGPGDQLRAEQRTWLVQLDSMKLDARVLKVTW